MALRKVFLVLLISVQGVLAWFNIEHMVIAQIAKNYASSLSFNKASSIIELLGEKYNSTAYYLEAACWADEVKKTAEYNYTVPWHFTRRGYSNDSTVAKDDEPESSIVNRLQSLFTEIDQSDVSEISSSQLRFLVHLIGDIHQPLHILNYFDASFPSGDQSGNLFFVREPGKSASEAVNLHAWTDGCAGFFSDCKELPVKEEHYLEIQNEASAIALLCDDEASGSFAFSPSDWANESFEAGVEIYRLVKQGEMLTEEQVQQVQTILKRQICRAGKRLAGSFDLIYTKFPPPSDFWFIMMVFVSLLGVVILDEVYNGGSCSKQRREYVGIENNKMKKVKFNFGNSKI